MTENFDHLSTLVEIDTLLNDEDDQCSKKGEEITTDIQINTNRFRLLCANVENCFFEIDKSMFEVLELKDKLLLQYLPRNVSLQIILVLSRFYRAYSQSQISVYELLRLVQLYSEPWEMKCLVLKRLYDSNETHKRMLRLAFQRLTSVDIKRKQYEEQKSINNWEKMYIRLALPRANVRKWKFRIKTFREKVELGYEHVIEWLHPRIPRASVGFETLSNEESIDDQDIHRPEISDEFVNTQEIIECESQIAHDSDDGHEKQRLLLNNHEKETSKPIEQQAIVTKIDIEIQAQPAVDDQQTSTNDILSTKSLILRIYRPIGIAKTKFQCIVHAQGRQYTTKIFIFHKSNVQVTNNSRISKIKNRDEVPITSDINTIDKQQTDECLIPMSHVLQRHSLFQTDTDPDGIQIDILADEKLCGSLVLSSEDLRMLDLPDLHSRIVSPSIALEDDLSTNHQLDFNQSSNELYQSWITRTPPMFSIYNNKYQAIGKLPLLMFWYHKLENTHATKSTMTVPMEARLPLPKVEIVMPPATAEMTEGNIGINSTDDRIEIIKENYENEIAKLHENYQAEIQQLTNLLDQVFSTQGDQTTPEIVQENLLNTNTRQQTKTGVAMERPSSLIDLPKNFLDRYQIYLQRSIIHRHQLIAKVEQETALANQRRMEIQHRLYKSEHKNEHNDDLCLPALFMPFRSGNVVNPRAYRYFHPVGTVAPRLTQVPSILKLPSLPSGSISVLNLFELSRSTQNSNVKDRSKNSSAE